MVVSRILLLLACILLPGQMLAIVGGTEARAGDTPWMVGLVDTARPDDSTCTASGGSELFCKHYCGAVLISPSWVATAAHCADNAIASVAQLVLVPEGKNLNDEALATWTVADKLVHPSHLSQPSFDNDIALLRLAAPATVVSASVASTSDQDRMDADGPSINDPLAAYGYGRLSSTGQFSAALQGVRLDIQADNVCDVTYNGNLIVNYFPTLMLCAFESNAAAIEKDDAGDPSPLDPDGEDVCTLDSGGPLLDVAFSGRVLGLVSFGDKSYCGDPQSPAVYTQLAAFTSWMETVTSTGNYASGLYALGDIGLDVSVAATGPQATPRPVTVTLKNNSSSRVFADPVFTVTSAQVPLGYDGGTVSGCSVVGDGFQCQVNGNLNPGASRQASFTLTPGTGDQATQLDVALASDAGEDYRADNNQRTLQVSFTDKPDIDLAGVAAVTERTGTGGRITLFIDITNSSSHVDATSLTLSVSAPPEADYSLVSASGATCGAMPSLECDAGGLAAGDALGVVLTFSSAGALDSDLVINLAAGNGDFPLLDLSASSDTSSVAQVRFAAPVSPGASSGSASAPPSDGGGGAAGVLVVIAGLVVLRRYGSQRWRPPSCRDAA